MRTLNVLFDANCGLCRRAAKWLHTQPAFLDIRTFPAGAEATRRRFAELGLDDAPGEVIVVADTGEVYRGSSAWIMCLYATRAYRPLAIRLAAPGWRPFVTRVIDIVSRNRDRISRLLCFDPASDPLGAVRRDPRLGDSCPTGACPRPAGAGTLAAQPKISQAAPDAGRAANASIDRLAKTIHAFRSRSL